MEVHHHPHVEKKSLKEYVLEGFMIFLAVTLGFFAENFREYIVNNERESQYIGSLYKDLKNDQKDLPRLINNIYEQQLKPAALMQKLFNNITIEHPADTIYYSFTNFTRQQGIKIYTSDRTIVQLKNSGEMRLIKDNEIAEAIIDYYKKIDFVDYLQQVLLEYKSKLKDNLPLILKSSDYLASIDSLDDAVIPKQHVYLNNVNPQYINRILIQVEDIRALSNTVKTKIELVLKKNIEIEKLIKSKFKIDD